MNDLTTEFNNQQGHGAMIQTASTREMEEVKGQIFMAKQFPRNTFESERRILDACRRKGLAEAAVYQYPRGGQKVSGPSIRLAEVLAQNWGNLAFGVKELERRPGESTAMSYCWDLETNVRREMVFSVKHVRGTKQGNKVLTDERDIYELVANNGARRLRACILSVIPGDVTEAAVKECESTLAGQNEGSLKDTISKMLNYFKETYKVTQEQIELYLGYNVNAFTQTDIVQLKKVATSLNDGMSVVEDYFPKETNKKPDTKSLEADFAKSEAKVSKTKTKAKTEQEVLDDSLIEELTQEVEQGELL